MAYFKVIRSREIIRRAQSTRTAKFDPRALSRKCSRKCPRECTRRCPRKCPRRLRLLLCKARQRVPTKTPTGVLTGKFPVLTEKFSSAHENVHESELGQFSHVLFSHVLFLGQINTLERLAPLVCSCPKHHNSSDQGWSQSVIEPHNPCTTATKAMFDIVCAMLGVVYIFCSSLRFWKFVHHPLEIPSLRLEVLCGGGICLVVPKIKFSWFLWNLGFKPNIAYYHPHRNNC